MTDYLAPHSRRYCKVHNTIFHTEDGCEFCADERDENGRRKSKRRLSKLETINRLDNDLCGPLLTPKRMLLSDQDAMRVGRCRQDLLSNLGFCLCFDKPTKCLQWDCHLWLGKPEAKQEEVTKSE